MWFILLGLAEPQRVATGVVSANFFDVLGVKPLYGRAFLAADDSPGAPAVLMLSYKYWQRSFRRRSVGRRQDLPDERPAAPGRRHPAAGPAVPDRSGRLHADVRVPVPLGPETLAVNRTARMMPAFARMSPGRHAVEGSRRSRPRRRTDAERAPGGLSQGAWLSASAPCRFATS